MAPDPLWGSEPPAAGSMTLGRASGGARVALHVSPVGDAQADFGARRVAALVLVVDPARRARIDPVRVAAVLGLSRSQGRVAALLAEGRSVREIAGVTGWTAGYVRHRRPEVRPAWGARTVNPDDTFERIVGLLHQATLDDGHWPATGALIDEAAGASGSALLIGEGFDDDFRVNLARLLRRGSRGPVLYAGLLLNCL